MSRKRRTYSADFKAKLVLEVLEGKTLPAELRDHELLGEHKGFREFHLGGDILLIYTVVDDVLYLQRIGTHSQLFK